MIAASPSRFPRLWWATTRTGFLSPLMPSSTGRNCSWNPTPTPGTWPTLWLPLRTTMCCTRCVVLVDTAPSPRCVVLVDTAPSPKCCVKVS
ncbi:unnamed protein product [Timema podura]|uniref:Secreted protein n=1 Tax=Timema podura TaxID=61482 RepID=A0ABN7PE65_TIMPD|nr:unnamed protein product [Timema podura]